MRYQQVPTTLTVSSGFISAKSTQLSRAMDRINRRSFYPASKSLNRVSEYSLPNSQIKDISRRAFSAVSRQRPQITNNVINVIKGKPHCVKLGQIDGITTGFGQIYNDFYTNIYSDRLPPRVKLTLDISRKLSKDQQDPQTSTSKMVSRARRKPKIVNIPNRLKSHQSVYVDELNSIIRGCNTLLQIQKPGASSIFSTYHNLKRYV